MVGHVSESNLPPEQWRPLFDKAGIEFGYRPLAARAGLTHTRVHRLIRGGGTTPEAIKQVADALGVAPSKVRALRDEPADVEPFTLPDDAGRLTHDERNVVRAVVRALLDARDRHADQPTPAAPPAATTRTPGAEDEKNRAADGRQDNVRDLNRPNQDVDVDPPLPPLDQLAAESGGPKGIDLGPGEEDFSQDPDDLHE